MGMRMVEKVRPILRVFGLFLVCMGVCGCSRVRDVANANREELPVEDVLGEMRSEERRVGKECRL